jgi:hypothetical protein
MSSPSAVKMETWLDVLWRSMPIRSIAGLDSFPRSDAAKCVEHYITTEVASSRFIQSLRETKFKLIV